MNCPETSKLSYQELIGILCNLASRLAIVEYLLLDTIRQDDEYSIELRNDFINAIGEQDKFLMFELLKIKADVYNYSRKTPFKKLDELETCLKGFICYNQEQITDIRELLPKEEPKKDKYEGIVVENN